jgi:adenylate cyclase
MERRLAAVLAVDVVGYSRLVEADETGTLKALNARRRQILEPVVAKYHGRIFKLMGDGALVEFASAVNAVQCAVELQEGMTAANASSSADRFILVRIGVNVGDVVVENGDLFGTGVNIAARLEALAEPGGICVAGPAYDQVRNRLPVQFIDSGVQAVKNVVEPVRVYSVATGTASQRPPIGSLALPLPSEPSIVVLPFANMTGDPEQLHFVDGIVEEITAVLSRVRSFFVIARNTASVYRNRTMGVAEVARELGVRYVVEGSVRRSGSRVRISTHLIDASNGNNIWAERYEGDSEDVFNLQDNIAASVAGAIEPRIRIAEVERARRKRPEKLEAYDFVMRSMPHVWALTPIGSSEALRLLGEALRLDPEYPLALSLASWCCAQQVVYTWSDRPEVVRAEGLKLAHAAIDQDSTDPMALTALGAAETILVRELDSAAIHIDKALAIDANNAWAWTRRGWLHSYVGHSETAISDFEKAMRLSPFDPFVFACYHGIGMSHFTEGRYGDAVLWIEKGIRERPNLVWQYRTFAAALAYVGRLDEARSAVALLRHHFPNLSISRFITAVPRRGTDVLARLAEGLRKAGLPE